MPATLATPAQDALVPATQDELAQRVRDCFASSTPVYPVGGGTKLGIGLPAKAPGKTLHLSGLNQVVDYPARDMTITVEAGLTLQRLSEILAGERQRLPIDVPHGDRATIGGVIATNTNGPRRFGEGSVRDYVIGIHAVDGRGQPFKGGGRVVKNVAGYDFCKLLTGSLGSLAVITQVTLRLKPIPEQFALLACSVPDLKVAESLLAGLIRSRTTPTAIELLAGPHWENAPTLRRLAAAGQDHCFLVAALEGTGPEVEYMTRQLLLEWREQGIDDPILVGESAALWQNMVEFPSPEDSPLVVQASVAPSGVTAVIDAARQLDPRSSLQAHAGSGSVIIKFADFPASGLSRALVGKLQPVAAAHSGHVRVLANPSGSEMTPQSVFGAIDAPLWLMRELKRQFDPGDILNRGRFLFS